MAEVALRVAVLAQDPVVRALVVRVVRAEGHDVSGLPSLEGYECQADVVLLDLALDGLRPESAVPRLLSSGTRVLVLSSGEFPERVIPALLSGASGLVRLDEVSPQHLVEAVDSVAGGGAALNPAVAAAVLDHWRNQRSTSPARSEELSDREREVLRAAADGLTTRAIAGRLELSPRTVENHKARIFAKLGARNQAQAVSIALDRGLLQG